MNKKDDQAVQECTLSN